MKRNKITFFHLETLKYKNRKGRKQKKTPHTQKKRNTYKNEGGNEQHKAPPKGGGTTFIEQESK